MPHKSLVKFISVRQWLLTGINDMRVVRKDARYWIEGYGRRIGPYTSKSTANRQRAALRRSLRQLVISGNREVACDSEQRHRRCSCKVCLRRYRFGSYSIH